MSDADPLLDVLLAGGRRADRVTHVEHLPAREGTRGEWPTWSDPDVVRGYQALGVERPWLHQVTAADAAWSGRHTVLATSTGSGKSLAFWLPALSAVRAPEGPGVTSVRRATTLYLCPTKALAADQLAGLERLLAAAQLGDLRVATCDGDTDTTQRRWVRDHADVVLTNPDFLHFALLPGHGRWNRLLRGLRYVVVDESHAFRGVFGAHVALVLRRLRRVAALHGRAPTFILASATTADPAESTARLVGVPADDVVAVTDDAQAIAEMVAPGFGLAPEQAAEALESPMALIGTEDEIVERLEQRRDRWGFSYFVVQNEESLTLAPIVARLTGS